MEILQKYGEEGGGVVKFKKEAIFNVMNQKKEDFLKTLNKLKIF